MDIPDQLVTVEELADRLPFVMDEDEVREADGALEDLSEDARHYGKATWTYTTAPRQVKNLILRAASRHMKNYDGYTQSRAGDETLAWTDRGHEAGSAYFTKREIQVLRSLAGNRNSGFHTPNVFAHGSKASRDLTGYVNDPGPGSDPVAYFAGDGPW